jgi:putative CocE/NonD family hydrolase
MKKVFSAIFLSIGFYAYTAAQQLYLPKAAFTDSVELSKTMTLLSEKIISNYKEDNRRIYLNTLFRLQIIAGRYSEANTTITSLRSISKENDPQFADLLYIQHELYTKARLNQTANRQSFNDAFTQVFNELFTTLDDKRASHIYTAFLTRFGVEELQTAFQKSLSQLKGKDSLTINEAIDLSRNYYLFQVYKNIEPLARELLKEDDNRRYIIEDSVLIKTRDGATISAVVGRSRRISQPQPVILQFTIYTGAILPLVKDAVANGYIGMVAFTRGKRYSPDEVIPYEKDGDDCYDVIDWISKQPWCNGKVGMYGGSYGGFTQWAATKHLHPALKTIVPSASAAPGLDVPMMNNVFESFVFPWIYYVSNNKFLDFAYYNNTAVWDSLFAKWYTLGLSYSLLDSLTGRGKNKIFQHWITHPSYDTYWQNMIPYKNEFSKIDIPVLTTTGYYDGGQVGAMYYFREHNKYNTKANHYLLIGPYSHFGSQGFLGALPDSSLGGYKIDPAANISIHDIIFQWFDYVLKSGKKPAILINKINYEVMGSNEWKHSPSLGKMNNDTLKFYLSSIRSNNRYELSLQKPTKPDSIFQKVDFSDRNSMNNYDYTNKVIYDTVDVSNGLSFISNPFKEPTEFTGNFTGKLHFSINKKDMDYSANVFELMPDGKYFYLTYFMGRASYALNNNKRQLLKPGERQTVTFTNTYMTSRKINKGSRIMILLNINKSPNEQINYGTGKDVSHETLEDAKTPLQIKWYTDSFIKIPVRK